MRQIKDILERTPFREIVGVVKITDHDPQRVWREMEEYVPTEKIEQAISDILDTLLETRRGSTERVCVWISGFFGSGKSHFLKVLGYLLEDHELQDESGNRYSSQEFLCRKLGFENFLPTLRLEFKTKVLFINLLDYDPQAPERFTFSRLIYRRLLEAQGLSTDFWVAEWEKELRRLNKWEEFTEWVREKYGRPWEEERLLNAEVVLIRALPALLPDRYRSEEEADRAIQNSKRLHDVVEPSKAVNSLVDFAEQLDKNNGRVIVLLDEVGLYIGDSVERLTDLNSLAEHVVQKGNGKILLIASAQEALRELVPRLTRDTQILNWLQDRFRTRIHLEPSEVQHIVAERLLKKTPKGSEEIRGLFDQKAGSLRAALTIDTSWSDSDFIAQYPCHPYAIRLIQDIMGAIHGSVEEARRLSGMARSVLQIVHGILRGEGGMVRGADQRVGWLIPLDLFFDCLRGPLSVIRSEQMRAFDEMERLGEVDGLPVSRVAKVLFLLQHVGTRYPCNVENLASALVDSVDVDIRSLRQKVKEGLQKLQEAGWVAEDDGKYRLLTPAQHSLEREINRNMPTVAEISEAAVELMREILRDFNYEHGDIRRKLPVTIKVDDNEIRSAEGGHKIILYTPFSGLSENEILRLSISDDKSIFWIAESSEELKRNLERAVAIKKTLDQWRGREFSQGEQINYREHLERESNQLWGIRLPQLMKEAFLRGKIFIGGRQIHPTGSDLHNVLKEHLRTLAEQIYTEFVDKRPSRDEECAAILTWQPGSALPGIYADLGILTPDQQIRRDNQFLSIVKGEIQRRQNFGSDCSGSALLSHFEKPPYGWDPRMVRLLIATLVKAGLVGVRYQNRQITDPTDPQLRSIFSQAREFQRAIFEILPEIDWRKASELCSQIFGVQGGDTFERVASVVKAQSQTWSQQAEQLATRCHDNGLPRQLEEACRQVSDKLKEISQIEEPNTRLRRFLEYADELSQKMPIVRGLKEFDFDQFRKLKAFAQSTSDWAQSFGGEIVERWRRFSEGIRASDLLDRWQSLQNDYAVLWEQYRNSYKQQHKDFQQTLERVLTDLRDHPAFQHDPTQAEKALSSLEQWRCNIDGIPTEDGFVCPNCQRQFSNLTTELIQARQRESVQKLDELLPKPEIGTIKPLQLDRTVQSESEIETIAEEVRRYFRQVGGKVRIQVNARKVEG